LGLVLLIVTYTASIGHNFFYEWLFRKRYFACT